MTLDERLQHGALMISFAVLAASGFALRFPDAWWVESLRGLTPSPRLTRGLVHRVAAAAMVLAGLYHCGYLAWTRRGRQLWADLLPGRQDVRDALQAVRHDLGLAAERPRFGRFGYVEKVEYWALVWGSGVMGATGFALWFADTTMGLLTRLGWEALRVVHYYEAWLAVLAVLVWHLYAVVLRPGVFPMNPAWWRGTVTERHMRQDHPLELERLGQRRAESEPGAGG